ncbi:MAG: GHKL domain-containing protein [Desulfotomaculaceae bacterium]|nr:GHKL domain-containing protein [Desulfotomaculaceae bacterium]
MENTELFSNFFISTLEAVLVTALGFLLIGIRPLWRDLIIIGLIQAAAAVVIQIMQVPIGLSSILSVIIAPLSILLVTRLQYWVVLLVALLGLIFYGAVETVVLPLMLYLSGSSITNLLGSPLTRIVYFLPQGLIMTLAIIALKMSGVSLLSYSKEYIRRGEYIPQREFKKVSQADQLIKNNIMIYVIVLTPLLLLVILNTANIAYQYDHINGMQHKVLNVLYGVFVVILTVISTGAVKKIGNYVEREYEAKRAEENLKQIEQLVYSSRKQRHDFHHQLQTVYGLLESGLHETARDYAQNLFNAATKTGELIRTDNLSISALLNTKLGLAEAKNVDLDISIECSLKDIPLTPLEASSLLGNLIDNALDAVEKNAGAARQIDMTIAVERGAYVITCTNTGVIDQEIIEKIFETNFTTKEGHPGLGLPIIKDIVTKYKGDLGIISDDQETTFTITIPYKKRRSDEA